MAVPISRGWFRCPESVTDDFAFTELDDSEFRLLINFWAIASKWGDADGKLNYSPDALRRRIAPTLDPGDFHQILQTLRALNLLTIGEDFFAPIDWQRQQGRRIMAATAPAASLPLPKLAYADNVFLYVDEYQKLSEAHGAAGAAEMVGLLANYKAASGRSYKSDYHAILNWVVKKWQGLPRQNGKVYAQNSFLGRLATLAIQ